MVFCDVVGRGFSIGSDFSAEPLVKSHKFEDESFRLLVILGPTLESLDGSLKTLLISTSPMRLVRTAFTFVLRGVSLLASCAKRKPFIPTSQKIGWAS